MLVSSDEHEELLSILDAITLREFAILSDLRIRELAHPRKEEENAFQHAQRYWDEFKTTTVNTYGVPAESFNALMARLERTGLYLRITGNYWDYSGDISTTTPLLARLVQLVNSPLAPRH